MEEEDGEWVGGGPGAAVRSGHAVSRAEGQSGSEGEGDHHLARPVRNETVTQIKACHRFFTLHLSLYLSVFLFFCQVGGRGSASCRSSKGTEGGHVPGVWAEGGSGERTRDEGKGGETEERPGRGAGGFENWAGGHTRHHSCSAGAKVNDANIFIIKFKYETSQRNCVIIKYFYFWHHSPSIYAGLVGRQN